MLGTLTLVMHPNSLDRRSFIQSIGGTVAATALGSRPLYGAVEDAIASGSNDGTINIPFFEPTEVLICGSSLFACQLALDSARRGKKTTLVMDRVNPFSEGISCLRSWIAESDSNEFPSVVRGVLAPETSLLQSSKLYFNASKAALEIEDRLIEAGVRFYYNASVAGAIGQADALLGVVFGGKTGLFAIESPVVVDATLHATIARAAGVRFTPNQGAKVFHYVVDLASPVAPRSIEYKASNGALVKVDIHHYFACFDVELRASSSGVFSLSEDFEKVYAASLEMPWTGSEKRFRGADGFLYSGEDRVLTENGCATSFGNLFVFGPLGVTTNTTGSLILKDWKALFKAFPDAITQIVSAVGAAPNKNKHYEFWNKGVPAESSPGRDLVHRFIDHGFDEPGTTKGTLRFTAPAATLSTSVLVSGGGTSGNAATYASASLNLNPVCIEKGFELGGTNTVGGVTNLWYGNRTKAFSDYYEAMEAANDGLNAPGFFKGVRKAGGNVLFGIPLTGVAVKDRIVARVYVLTPFGMTAIDAKHHIDATGDGSIAAWAGCGYSFGGEHDELTLWASFAGYKPGKAEALRPFLSPCDERSAVDGTRFILSMRRNSKISLDQPHVPPPFYLAPRESRHIYGGKTLTFLDLLAGRRFKDGVFRVESNPDIKGLATSDAAKSGFIPTDWRALYRATVPYAALVPSGVDNVIIAGKAYSVTHDALAAARMQRDLCVMGMVAAHSVSMAVNKRRVLRDISVPELQAILISKGMLKPDDVSEDDFGFGMTPEEIAKKVSSASSMDKSLPLSAMLCLLPRPTALKALDPFVSKDNPSINRVLSFLGIPAGLGRYLAQAEAALIEPVLSTELYGGTATKHMMPDQGYAPVSALILGSLTHAREPRTVSLLVQLAKRVDLETRDLRATWGYLYSLACGFERLACKEGVSPLKHVLSAPLFQDCTVSRSGDLRACRDIVAERLSYLKMALNRALLRCGDVEGAIALCGFLNEARVCIARAARSELVAATSQDFGYSQTKWLSWIHSNASAIRINPLTRSFL